MTEYISEIIRAIDNNSENPELEDFIISRIEGPYKNRDETFLICKYIYKFKNGEGKFTEKIIEALEWCLQNGLIYENSPDMFLEANIILADFYSRFHNFKKLGRCLVHLETLYSKEKLPSWLFYYKAKYFYETDVINAIRRPDVFIQYVEDSGELNESSNERGSFILKDYINKISDALNLADVQKRLTVDNFLKIQEVFEPYLELITYEWATLNDRLKNIYQNDDQWKEVIRIISSTPVPETYFEDENEEIERLEKDNLELRSKVEALEYQLKKEVELESPKKFKILLLGDTKIDKNHIEGIKKEFESELKIKIELKIEDEYEKIKNEGIEKLRYKYNGILVGPVPHSISGMGSNSSIIAMMEKDDGFKPFEVLRTKSKNGKLKVGKTNFKEGLRKLLSDILSSSPSQLPV